MKVIFLDVDGVLIHNETLDGINLHIDEENVKILKEIVDKTDAKIVLSSSWRKEYNKDFPGKRNRYKVLENHEEINSFLILDDNNHEWDYFGYQDNFIKTDPNNGGLQKEHVEEAVNMLNNPKVKKR